MIQEEEAAQEEIESDVFHAFNHCEDIEFVWAHGLEVDDNNEPAPKDIPEADAQVDNSNMFAGQRWGYDGVDARAATGVTDQLPGFHGNWNPGGKSLLQIFMKFIPYKFIVDVVVKCISNALISQNKAPLNEGEFLRYLGLWLLIRTCSRFAKKDIWEIHPDDEK